ncbi:hypothetical protein SteCoe_15796 [Stentor coeruleus]|uniref:SET domain-containing protein n=1 Tax=Stentor coeruleus TaxID=5963 RepID=A0A1R2C2S5_9CILI|nr:hypothetical protein SteCoe_15796 [Stentor coeruleus]
MIYLLTWIITISGYSVPVTISQTEESQIISILNSFYNNAYIRKFPDPYNYAIIADKDIGYNNNILSVPIEYLITGFDVFPWSRYIEDLENHMKLALRLIYEKFVNGKRDMGNLMVHFFPTSFSGFFNYTDEEKAYFSLMFDRRSLVFPIDCEEDYDYFIRITSQIEDMKKCEECIKKDTWMWSCMALLTRTITIEKSMWGKFHSIKVVDEQKRDLGPVIVPGLDLMNHIPLPIIMKKTVKKNFIEFNDNTLQLEYSSQMVFKKGNEVFTSYGEQRNIDLLIAYGFYVKENNEDFLYFYKPSVVGSCRNFDYDTGNCIFELFPLSLNLELLNVIFKESMISMYVYNLDDIIKKAHKTDNGKVLVKGLIEYRENIVTGDVEKCKVGLREIRRITEKEKRAGNFKDINGVCEEMHKTFYYHLRKADRALLKLLISS